MYAVQHALDYVSRYTDLLLAQWRRPRREAVLAALLQQVQDLEDAAYGVLDGFDIDTAIGAQLDALGKVLRVPRLGLLDEPYRLRLKVEILVLRSRGTPDDLIRVALAAHPDGVELTEYTFATTYVRLEGSTSDAEAAAILGFLRRAKSAGTRLFLEYAADSDRVFRFSSDDLQHVDIVHGFGDDTDPLVGGLISAVIA